MGGEQLKKVMEYRRLRLSGGDGYIRMNIVRDFVNRFGGE